MEDRVFENFWKKTKNFQSSRKAENRHQKCPNVFWTCFGANFSKKTLCPVFNGGSRLLKLEKSRKSLKNPNMPKIVPKSVQTCFEHVLGQIFWKIFAQFSVEGRVFKNFQKYSKKFSKFQKYPKSFPKVSRSVLGWFSRKKIYAQCSMEGQVFENFQKKIIQKSKKSENCSQKCPNVFWTCFGAFFWKVSWPVFHGGSRLRIFSKKNLKNVKIPKMFKIVRKSVQKCFGVIFSKKILCTVFHGGSSFRKFSKKNYSKIQKCRKLFPKVSKCVLNMFWGIFLKSFMASVPWRLETSKIFKKNLKNVKIPKMFQIVRKSVQKCFGVIFSKKFHSQFSMEGRVL